MPVRATLAAWSKIKDHDILVVTYSHKYQISIMTLASTVIETKSSFQGFSV